jgi:hypothetical protein
MGATELLTASSGTVVTKVSGSAVVVASEAFERKELSKANLELEL